MYYGRIHAMRTTIDSAGRLVVPKEVRQQAQLKPGAPLEIQFREGRIEIEPVPLEVSLKRRGRLVVAVPRETVTPLTSETVEESRRRLRRERAGD
jgi:AbrB family looped-hinge helix DNA binding protein